MTEDDLNKLLAKPGYAIVSHAPVLARAPRKAAKLEPDSRDAPLGTGQIQEAASGRFLVRIKSLRKRLLDEDNLCEKFVCDLLRYSGVIPDDSAAKAKIEVSQEKISSKETERVEISVTKL